MSRRKRKSSSSVVDNEMEFIPEEQSRHYYRIHAELIGGPDDGMVIELNTVEIPSVLESAKEPVAIYEPGTMQPNGFMRYNFRGTKAATT